MNKGLVAAVVAITGILLAATGLFFGDRKLDETEAVEPTVWEAAVTKNRNLPEVSNNPVNGNVIENRRGSQPVASKGRDAHLGLRNPPPIDYRGLDDAAKEAIYEMLKTESSGLGKRN
ncbi:MAG: hypothetical protein JJ957_08810 [Pseudomonadales bacterium]|nr:hypothetical protein [Pseudomonadales bacterium]MBO6596406.1 hypothetical protein [Pseudomonadales bacterium]MBO6822886.1 hypothetical protein [Pseudomonadales bacterium]